MQVLTLTLAQMLWGLVVACVCVGAVLLLKGDRHD